MSITQDQASGSPKPRDAAWGGSSGSNLYLATFLATLFLLLIGSCCIVVRSYIMRRRMRRHIHELFTTEAFGTTTQRCKCRRRRPKLHDKWISPALGASWEEITPLSLRVVLGKRSSRLDEPQPEVKPDQRRLGFKGWTSSGSCKPAQDVVDNASTPTKIEIAQVSVLIEMPSQERSTLYGRRQSPLKPQDGEEDESENETLPELVLGYARCYKHWWMDVMTNVASARTRDNDTHQPH